MMKIGTLIHQEKPFVHVLSQHVRSERCDHCYSSGELFKCSACQYVKYCDRSCQKAAWVDHKSECSNLKALPQHRELPNSARLLARIIMKLKRDGLYEKGFYDKMCSFRTFKDLMSHYSDVRGDQKREEHLKCLYSVLQDYMGADNLPNYSEFTGLYGRVIVNSYSIVDGEMVTLGTGIYLGASTIDHSCRPNAVASFVGTTIFIRLTEDVQDYKWSKVRISYIETLKPTNDRLKELRDQYYFDCDCPMCATGSAINSIENSICCQNCSSPVNATQDEVICDCNWKPSSALLNDYQNILTFTKDQHEKMKNVAYLDTCKICLDKQKLLFHPVNIYRVKTMDLTFEAAIQLQKWEDTLAVAPDLINGYREYLGSHHPFLGLLLMKYGKILLYVDQGDGALTALEEAERIIKVTHGSDHPLYRYELSRLVLEAKSLVYS